MNEKRRQDSPALSVILPALDAAERLPATLDSLEEGRACRLIGEILVVDGGSRDATREVAAARGARVLESAPGRGHQLAAGAAAAAGDWLLFLHADTRLEPGWAGAVARYLDRPEAAGRAAAFGFALDDPDPRARRIERWARRRSRLLALPYGDQGLLMGRRFYDALGGFPEIALMEDVALVRRVGRRRLDHLGARALTSAARYRRDGWLLRPLRNLALLGLYFLGVPPAWLRRLY